MLFLIAIVIAAGFAWFCAKPLHQNPVPFYIAAVLVTVCMTVIGQLSLPLGETVVLKSTVDLFHRGILAAALWCVVAYIGALPNGSALMKRLMPARGELSIFAAVITLSHAVTWSVTYVQRLTKLSAAGKAPTADFITSCILCLLLMCIMLPLTVLSFKAVRKKMQAKKWKSVQRFAYLFYALIYAHVMVIYIPRVQAGRNGALLSVIAYSAVFIGYAVLRLRKLFLHKRKTESTLLPNAVCLAAFGLCMGSIGLLLPSAQPEQIPVTAETEPMTEAPVPASEETQPTETESRDTEPVTSEPTEPTEMTEETTETTEPTDETEETATETSSEEEAPQEQQQDEPEPEPQPEPEPEPQYTYNNGTFSGHGTTPMDQDKDYEGYVDVRVTIENDVILSIEITGWGDDPDYYWMAENEIPGRILSAQSPDVDAVCGATRSAEGLREAVRNALDNARR